MGSRSRLSYHRRLFLWLLAYSWLLVGAFAVFQYFREKEVKAQELNARLQLVNAFIIDNMIDGDSLSLPSHSFKDLRVSVIGRDGKIVYDNTLDSLPASDHNDRQEIRQAKLSGEGYTRRRHSESTGQTYFYSAKSDQNYIVRTAVPYDESLSALLGPDYGFIWFMVGVTLLMCVLGYFAVRRIGLNIRRLNSFAKKAERGERIYDTEPFPHDELGEISSHIVRLYARLQNVIAERDREHQSALYEQQEKIRIKHQLTNNINHELKTPVAAMQVCLETLRDHPDLPEEKKREFIRRCLEGCERLGRLLADVSQITRMEDGSSNISMENVNVREIVAEVCEDFTPRAESLGVTISNGIDHDVNAKGNAPLLASVFRNLIDNALSYSECSRIEIRMAEAGSDRLVFTVADDGCGVGQEHLPRLFERFYRVDKGRSRQAGGTGLGLAIVKNAIRLHGGEITVENRRSGGLIFRFTMNR